MKNKKFKEKATKAPIFVGDLMTLKFLLHGSYLLGQISEPGMCGYA